MRIMAWLGWFNNNRLYPVVEWLWLKLALMLRCARRRMSPIVGYVLLSIRWRRDDGRRAEAETKAEGKLPERSSSLEIEEESPREGQGEAAAEKRAAEYHRELKQQRYDEEEDEYRVETTDELYCDYDSTWETEERQKSTFMRTRRRAASRNYKFNRFENAARDMQNYRHDYRHQTMQHWNQQSDDKPNLRFYLGSKRSVPDDLYIHNFHKEWYGQYDKLESVHSYIQWLFPLQEPGMNYQASTLTKGEIKEFCQNDTAKANLLKSYKLMLDFYGIKLCDEKTGEVKRASNWSDRFNNLNSHTHNNLRITRILKCLGTLSYCHYQAPLVQFFLEETLVHGHLPNVKDSVLNYFVFAVLDNKHRRSLIKFAYLNYDHKDDFIWCPKKIQMIWSRQEMNVKRNAPELDPESLHSGQ